MAQTHTRGGFRYLIPAFVALVSAVFISTPGTAQKPESAIATARPPVAPIRMVTDEYFGVKVPDPYRYMENLKDPAVAAWFKGQNDYTRSVLARIPGRTALLKRIEALDESVPAYVFDVRRLLNGLYFYQKRRAQEEIAKIYVREGLNGTERLLVDPTKLQHSGGPHYSISYYSPSLDGRYIAFVVFPAGSEEHVIRALDVQTGKETGEAIEREAWGGASWLPDNRSFLYTRRQKLAPDAAPADKYLNIRVYFHRLGTSPDQDTMVFGTGLADVKMAASDIPFVTVIPGSSYVIGLITHGAQPEATLYSAPVESMRSGSPPWSRICDVEDQVTAFDVHGDNLYLLSHLQASRFKVLHTRLSAPNISQAEMVVPPGQAVIRNIAAAEDALYVQTMDGGIGRVLRVLYGNNKPEQVELPFDGAVNLSATDQRVRGTLLEIESWAKGKAIYAYDPQTKQITDTGLQPKGAFDELPGIESIEVKAPSYDGTLIPLSIMRKNGVKLDGSNPTLLDGYGAYGDSYDAYYDPRRLAWFEQGGVIAVAHVRGGGEYGEDWHLAGKGLTKQNTWKDFIACAEFLINEKYTSPARLAIVGGSAGGITVGRSITERPDLFAVALDLVPMSDAVRNEFTPTGPGNIPEFGTVKTEDGFKGLYAMSPYHHVKDGTRYPAVLITTGFNDPRVVSWEPGKLAARLQAATSSGKPVLLRVDYDAGHGFGSTKTQQDELLADQFSFALWQFGIAGFQPATDMQNGSGSQSTAQSSRQR